jgi:lysyl-tRNA synthetase class 2
MASRLDEVARQRQQKLDQICRRGIDPYPGRYHRSHTAAEARSLLEKQGSGQKELPEVTVAGRLIAHRSMGEIQFLDIRDGSGKVQLHIHKKQLTEDSLQLLDELDIGDIIGAGGKPCYTKRGEPSIDTNRLTLLAKSLKPLPEKWHGLQDVDTRYRHRYLDLISNPQVKETFKVRSRVIATVRDFLNNRGFLEVETPMLQPSAGGALARPFVTHHHALDHDFYLRIALGPGL